MHRRRGLVSLLMAVMAIAGATAMPSRSVESTRLVASIVRLQDSNRKTQVQCVSVEQPISWPIAHFTAAGTRDAGPLGSPLPLVRFQRPPPQT